MKDISLQEKVIGMEKKMWEAFASGNSASFGEIVSADAMMICGGFKEIGAEYARIVENVNISNYELSEFDVKVINPNVVLTNYIVKVDCQDYTLAGTFRVSSLWINEDGNWKVVFNQDSNLVSQ
ncbi:hypothetical protein Cpap_3387 [Ruminiclostridium papyrosolvens DSM 2782]|uniref:DUF4440 domain-containing protein n=1 Tax=Ruminiclostridium papyrosolvens DSM 2782 TaxID=588581 RepID=F1T8X8_9FIRM|nr:nuclear transport factor 2 family protein [Ruminiclostridium papyrosolvens]EGD48960.1 hypothetical protein Cpap_3387 [Ruminiclostridium papyrosolvens DSM 2782]WES35444.1 nuclear transport factor 2 family protein [Ruminiclostridium papyrosolvens DSM 2782]